MIKVIVWNGFARKVLGKKKKKPLIDCLLLQQQ